MATQERAFRSKRKILEAAGNEFRELGFAASTMKNMASRMDLTTGAITFHFASKEAIARDLIVVEEEIAQLVRDRYPAEGDSGRLLHIGQLVALMREWAYLIKSSPIVGGAIRLIVERPEFVDDEYESWAFWVTKIEAMLVASKKQGELNSNINISELAEYIAESFTGIQLVSAAATQYDDFLDRFDRAWRITSSAIASPSALPRFQEELAALRATPFLDSLPSRLNLDDAIDQLLFTQDRDRAVLRKQQL